MTVKKVKTDTATSTIATDSEVPPEKPFELKIFKTSEFITSRNEDPSRKVHKESPPKNNFLKRMGFGSGTKSASVSPTKSMYKVAPPVRRPSELGERVARNFVERARKLFQPPNVEVAEDVENSDNVTEFSVNNLFPKSSEILKPHLNEANQMFPATTGTDTNAHVSQTIIMKKKSSHEAGAETILIDRTLQLTQTSTVSTFKTPDCSSSFKKPLPSSQKPPDTVARTTKASSVVNQRSTEFDLPGPLARLDFTLAASNNGSTTTSVEKTPSQTSETTLAEKLSKSFFDLTQGSQDRLQKWKTKLQSGKKQKNKDGSEPKGVVGRKLSNLNDMDSLMNWTVTNKPKFVVNHQTCQMTNLGPRSMHTSQSATNALSITDATVLEMDVKRISLRDSTDMEHRTLKLREKCPTVGNRTYYQNMKSLQHLIGGLNTTNSSSCNSFIETDLPPPARIMPYSGIKPQNNGIVRPVAFRPLNQQPSKNLASTEVSLQNRKSSHSIGNLVASTSSSVSGFSNRSQNNFFPIVTSHSISQFGLMPNATSTSNTIKSSSTNDENDYDTVPDTYDQPCTKVISKVTNDLTVDNYDLIYSFQHPQTENPHHKRAQLSGSRQQCHTVISNSNVSSSISSSTTSGLPHSSPSSLKKSGSRHSGLHITPSPSDSGIVDFENILRDKENELTNVRTTMEQNEEVLVRVYQDKERHYRNQLADLRAKLQTSQQGEAALRHQLRMIDEKRSKMQNDIDTHIKDKLILERKCVTLEREFCGIQNRFENYIRDSKTIKCNNCERRINHDTVYENSMALIGGQNNDKAVVPTPKHSKETSFDDDQQNNDLRGQVDNLRTEILILRNQLHLQLQLFADERRRFEGDLSVQNSSSKSHLWNSTPEERGTVLLSNDRFI